MLISYLDSSLHTDSKTVLTFYFYSLLKKNHWKFNKKLNIRQKNLHIFLHLQKL